MYMLYINPPKYNAPNKKHPKYKAPHWAPWVGAEYKPPPILRYFPFTVKIKKAPKYKALQGVFVWRPNIKPRVFIFGGGIIYYMLHTYLVVGKY